MDNPIKIATITLETRQAWRGRDFSYKLNQGRDLCCKLKNDWKNLKLGVECQWRGGTIFEPSCRSKGLYSNAAECKEGSIGLHSYAEEYRVTFTCRGIWRRIESFFHIHRNARRGRESREV